jgi:small subunit ribosomal protein S17
LVDRYVKHPKYKKYLKRSKKYKAHDENKKYKLGDIVVIEETKPVSKDKHFKVIEKI